MTIVTQMMLLFLIMCAIAVCLTRNLLTSVIIYMGYSMIMSIIWITLESPDLAITEAAVGAGVTSLLFFLTLKKIHAIDARNEVRRAHAQEKQNEQNGGANISVFTASLFVIHNTLILSGELFLSPPLTRCLRKKFSRVIKF